MDQLIDLIADTQLVAMQVLKEFADAQKQTWPLAKANYEGLNLVEVKQFQFDGFQIKVQFNPERMRSSVAKVDKKSIAERTCFLCNENRPHEQQAIAFGDEFQILVNPYPIFKTHFTISSNIHIAQRFIDNTHSMLELAAAMEGFTIVYNGPESGASAPDHLHFQAGESTFLPVTQEFKKLKSACGQLMYSGEKTKVWAFNNYLRKMISIETILLSEGLEVMDVFFKKFSEFQPEKIEPMMNVLCSYTKGKWIIHLFPRKTHRPAQYFANGEDQLLISPGSVDLGGVFVVPRNEDFKKITKLDIIDILAQVTLNQTTFAQLTKEIAYDLKWEMLLD